MDALWPDLWPKPETAPQRPANLYDQDAQGGSSLSRCLLARHGSTPAATALRSANLPYPGAINMSFVDGHVDAVKLNALWNYYWYNGSTPRATPPSSAARGPVWKHKRPVVHPGREPSP